LIVDQLAAGPTNEAVFDAPEDARRDVRYCQQAPTFLDANAWTKRGLPNEGSGLTCHQIFTEIPLPNAPSSALFFWCLAGVLPIRELSKTH